MTDKQAGIIEGLRRAAAQIDSRKMEWPKGGLANITAELLSDAITARADMMEQEDD